MIYYLTGTTYFDETNFDEYCHKIFRYIPFHIDFGTKVENRNKKQQIFNFSLSIFKNIENVFRNHLIEKYKKEQLKLLEQMLWHYLLEIHIPFFIKEHSNIKRVIQKTLHPTLEALFGSFLFLPPVRYEPKKIYFENELLKALLGDPTLLVGPFKEETGIKFILKNVSEVNSRLLKLGLSQKVIIRKIKDDNIPKMYVLEIHDKQSKHISSLNEVGYGLSQILPILFSLTDYYTGRKVIIEQPELHLHPALQSRLSEIISDSVMNSRKDPGYFKIGEDGVDIAIDECDNNMVILETHSEHIIRGIQLQVAKGKILPDDVAVNFIGKYKNGNSFVKRINLTKTGLFEEDWPGGLFEDSFNQSLELLKNQ